MFRVIFANMAEEMSGDEGLTLLIAFIIALVGGMRWCFTSFRVTRLGSPPGLRAGLFLVPPICLALLFLVLVNCSAGDFRGDWRYIALFLCVGAAWLTVVGGVLLPILGLSPREDAMEGRNPAAVTAISGALLGAMLCFAGSNVGEGPTIWTTIGPAALATGALFTLFLLQELASSVVGSIVVDRDPASGLRLAALLVASGLILGRGMAGDYQSAENTLSDFVSQGWPAAVLTVAGTLLNHSLRPTPRVPRPRVLTRGAIPSFFYLAAAVAWALHLGHW